MTETDRTVAEESTRLMAAGMDLINRSEWSTAAGVFREAGRLRDSLPWQGNEEFAWMVAAAWLNHGDMLIRTGNPTVRKEAIASFDKVIAAMAYVRLDAQPGFAERLILTWLNRAGAWTDEGDVEAALADFREAEKVLRIWGEEATPVSRFMAGMLRINRARLMIREKRVMESLADITHGIAFLKPLDLTAETARAHIQARSLRCRALALLLDEKGGAEKVGDWIAEATDSAEEALALVRASGFRDEWVSDLVRYGAKIYQVCQPHFLGEFLAEWLGPQGPLSEDAVLKKEMGNVLLVARLEVERKVLAFAHDTEFVAKQTTVLRSLQRGMAALS